MEASDRLLNRLSEVIAANIGLRFPEDRLTEFGRAISAAAPDFGFDRLEPCVEWLLSSPLTADRIDILASHLTIGETYFFREKGSLEIFEYEILPELTERRRKSEKYLRIWCAGCASGEEPYSIAITIHKNIADLKEWKIDILATDINPYFLAKAKRGIYTRWSFRDAPRWLKQKYFKPFKAARYEILPEVRDMVLFFKHNLADDVYPPALSAPNSIDVVFCRNVFIYFTQECIEKALAKFHYCLAEDGKLFTSAAESLTLRQSLFAAIFNPTATFYRKASSAERAAVPPTVVEDIYERIATASSFEPPINISDAYPQEKPKKILNPAPKKLILAARKSANNGRLDEAQKSCEAAIEADKLDPKSRYLLATILMEREKFKEAAQSLRQALYLDPNFAAAHFTMGNLARKLGRAEESNRHFENALSILSGMERDEVPPEAEGMTAGRLIEIIRSMIGK